MSIAVAKNLHDVWLEKSQGEPVFEDAYFNR
jgi:peptide/nickel transport system substrate-binding protein